MRNEDNEVVLEPHQNKDGMVKLDRFRNEFEKRVWVAEFERGDRKTHFNAGGHDRDIVASSDVAVLEFRARCA